MKLKWFGFSASLIGFIGGVLTAVAGAVNQEGSYLIGGIEVALLNLAMVTYWVSELRKAA